MPRTKVSRDQFTVDGRRIIHQPTGARFEWSYPNSQSDAVTVNWGEAGNVLANSDDYDRDDIGAVAKELLDEQRMATPPRPGTFD